MKIVALTGGIGSGKSTIARMFMAQGIPVYDSDKEAKRLLNNSKKLKKELISLLGAAAYDEKSLNKKYISSKIFKDKSLLLRMNKIVHPAVRRHFMKWAKQQDAPYVIQETAIVFENGNQHRYDAIVLITAPQNSRTERVMSRDAVSKEQVLVRMKNQWSDQDKIPLADFIIENTNLEKATAMVAKVHLALLDDN